MLQLWHISLRWTEETTAVERSFHSCRVIVVDDVINVTAVTYQSTVDWRDYSSGTKLSFMSCQLLMLVTFRPRLVRGPTVYMCPWWVPTVQLEGFHCGMDMCWSMDPRFDVDSYVFVVNLFVTWLMCDTSCAVCRTDRQIRHVKLIDVSIDLHVCHDWAVSLQCLWRWTPS